MQEQYQQGPNIVVLNIQGIDWAAIKYNIGRYI